MTTKEYEKIIKMIMRSVPRQQPSMSFTSFGHGYSACRGDIIKKLAEIHEGKTISE